MEKLLSVKGVSQALGYSEWTVRKWLREGKIKSIKMSNSDKGRYRVTEDEVARVMREGI